MKTLLIVNIVFILMLSASPSCSNAKKNKSTNPETFELRSWWNGLNDTWQELFLREIDKIGKKPTDEDLIRIINLEQFEGDHYPIGDAGLKPLTKLKRLKVVSVASSHISTIAPLAELDSLVSVNLAAIPIDNIDALTGHKSLEEVYIQQTLVSDLDPLKGKEQLQVIVFSETKVSSLSPIMDLPLLSIVVMSDKVPQDQMDIFVRKHKDCDISY